MKETLPNKIKIATYAIAKNEEKHIARWLEATRDSDYRVVLDTGSTDRTVELLKAAGNVIVCETIVSPWRFDVARNQALDCVPEDADLCLVLDMDELPEKHFYRKVREQWVPGAVRGLIAIDTAFKWEVDRLHSRKGWVWKWPVHEAAVPIDGDMEYEFCHIKATITHQPDTTKSRSLYLPLLEAAVIEMPEDIRMWTYLCREYYYESNWTKVLECANKVLSLDDGLDSELATVCRWAADAARNLGQPTRDWFIKGIDLCPDQGEPWLGLAADALRRGDYEEALSSAIECIEKPVVVHYLHEPSVWRWKGYDVAAQAAFHLKMLDEALVFAYEASKAKGPETERIKRNITMMEKMKRDLRAYTKSQNLGNRQEEKLRVGSDPLGLHQVRRIVEETAKV